MEREVGGNHLNRNIDYRKAIRMYQKAIQANPYESKYYGAIAFCYQALENHFHARKYFKMANRARNSYYQNFTKENYNEIRRKVQDRGIQLVCVQYPMRSIVAIKKLLDVRDGIIFVDNEVLFKKAVRESGFDDYFIDYFAGDFGHCTDKGNRLLANNIANAVLRKYF